MAVWVTAAFFLASLPIPARSGHGAMLTNSLYSDQEACQKPYRTVVTRAALTIGLGEAEAPGPEQVGGP